MPRRLSLVILLSLIIGSVLLFGLSAGAAPDDTTAATQAELEAAQKRIEELEMQEDAAYQAYSNALFEQNRLRE